MAVLNAPPEVYMLIVEYMDGTVTLCHTKLGSTTIAHEGNQYLLEEIGERLMAENLIKGYQLAKTCGPVVRP